MPKKKLHISLQKAILLLKYMIKKNHTKNKGFFQDIPIIMVAFCMILCGIYSLSFFLSTWKAGLYTYYSFMLLR